MTQANFIKQLADQIIEAEFEDLVSTIVITGDINHINLSAWLPKCKQLISCPMREDKKFDHCYNTMKDTYQATSQAPLGISDHPLI